MLYEILFLKAFRPNFAKMRQRSPLRNFITFLAKKQGQQVEEFMIKTLANLDEQLWNENGFLRELGKPKQILHTGILLDGLDGLLIAQPLWHASLSEHQQPCGLIACTVVSVLQSLVVFLLYLVPGKIVGKLHPAVGLAQTRERDS